jgi:lysophospholipase L1-like esterase
VHLSRKKKILFTVITLLLLLVVTEVSLRIIRFVVSAYHTKSIKEVENRSVSYNNPYTDSDIYGDEVLVAKAFYDDLKQLRLAYRPYVERRRIPNQHFENININKWGYRGPEFTLGKPDGLFRIILFGGSFVWGTGAIRDYETISGHLQKLLEKRYKGRKFEVINAGETGYVTTQERILFLEESILFSPDLVIFIDGANDVMVVFGGKPAGFPAHYEAFNERLSADYKEPIEKTLEEQVEFLRNQVRLNLQRPNLKGSSELLIIDTVLSYVRKLGNNKDLSTQIAAKHFHNAKIIHEISKARGINCLFAIQPTIYIDKPLTSNEGKMVQYYEKRFHGIGRFYRSVYPRYRDILSQEMNKEGIPFCDLTVVFRENSSNQFIDHFHLSGKGYRIIAENILDFLNRNSLLE